LRRSGHQTPVDMSLSKQGSQPMRYRAKVPQRFHTAASNYDRQHMGLAGKAAGLPAPHVVRDKKARARCVPDRAANHRQRRSTADKIQRGSPALMQVTAHVVAAFQAGHEGSIPFARSGTIARSAEFLQVRASCRSCAVPGHSHLQPNSAASLDLATRNKRSAHGYSATQRSARRRSQ
jgi:hypothetical protein